AADEDKNKPHRFAIDFKTLIVNQALRNVRRQYVFDGQWLADIDHERKFFLRRQVVAPGEPFNPLQLDGPFPVPIGQKRQAVLGRFKVKIVPPTESEKKKAQAEKTEPPLHLHLIPKARKVKPENQADFKSVDLWFDRKTLMPVRVETTTKQIKTSVDISRIQLNRLKPAEAQKKFDTTPPAAGAGWRVEIEKLKP
ncbi:MAG: hypothetical protein R3236_08465, partial [Phycisphaeraceae bacterium]|nr:hypothetical protein [Phycisphaeraceae bacterium]